MGIDVTYLLRFNSRVTKRLAHDPNRAGAGLVRHGEMKRIGSHAVAHQFGVDAGASPLGKFKFFEDDYAGALANDKTVSIALEWSRRVLWIIVASGERAHGGESGNAHRRDRRLGAPANHYLRVTTLNDLKTVPDGVGASRTSGSGR